MPLPDLVTEENELPSGEEVVLERVANLFGMTGARLVQDAPQWAGICNRALVAATGRVQRLLTTRGYTPAQIAADPGIGELTSRCAVCYAAREGAVTGSYETKAVDSFCEAVEKELAEFPVLDTANESIPAPVVSGGRLDAFTACDAPPGVF